MNANHTVQNLRQTVLRRAAQYALLFALSMATRAAAEDFSKSVQPFLKQHCHDCHGPEKQKDGIRYDQLGGFRAEDRQLWTMVHEQLSAGEMPPEKQPQPPAAEKQRVLAWIESEQRALHTDGTRRLNRREISAALQDVTGRRVDYTYGLPEDGKVGGFDTGAEGLQDTADSIAQLLEVARRAVDGVRFLEPATNKVFQADLRAHKDPRRALDDWKKDGVTGKIRGMVA